MAKQRNTVETIRQSEFESEVISEYLFDMPAAFVALNKNLQVQAFSKAFYEWAPDIQVYKPIDHVLDKDLYNCIREHVARALDGFTGDCRIFHPEQTEAFYLMIFKPVAQGCLLFIQPLAGHLHEDSEDYDHILRTTFNTIDQGISIYDENLALAAWNKRYEELMGLPEQKQGTTLFDLYLKITETGIFGSGDPKQLAKERIDLIKSGKMVTEEDLYPPNGNIIHIHRFYLSTGGICAVFTDVTEERKAEQKLLYQATHDNLTKIVNREFVVKHIEELVMQTPQQAFAILFLDLDRFKPINDSFGHSIGDQLLKACVERVVNLISYKEGDIVARIGGDEFLLVIKNQRSLNNLSSFSQRLCKKISEQYSIDHHKFHISASIGICKFPDDGNNSTELIAKADIAMYKAKLQGGSYFEFYNKKLGDDVKRRTLITNYLNDDLRAGTGFRLVFQPMFSCKTKSICGAEALLRWDNSSLGNISPAEFIPSAEDVGLINQLGNWVIEQVLQCLSQQKKIQDDFYVSINVSPLQLLQADFSETLNNYLQQYNIPAKHIMIEITENSIMDDIDVVSENLQNIRLFGCKLAIDDFGSGYSSLSYIQKYPFTHIKIDRAFIKSIPDNENNSALCKAIIQMSKALSLNVIGEGIETEQQLVTLADYGLDYAQGFFLSKPIEPFEEVVKLK